MNVTGRITSKTSDSDFDSERHIENHGRSNKEEKQQRYRLETDNRKTTSDGEGSVCVWGGGGRGGGVMNALTSFTRAKPHR